MRTAFLIDDFAPDPFLIFLTFFNSAALSAFRRTGIFFKRKPKHNPKIQSNISATTKTAPLY
jgi:hypothetical protein